MPSFPGGVGLVLSMPLNTVNPVVPEMMFSVANLHPPMNYEVRWDIPRGLPVDAARCQVAARAVQQKARYLFFNDSDVTVPAHTIRQLIFHLDHFPKYAVAAAIYCHKSVPQAPMVFRGNGIGPWWDWKIGEVFDIDGCGMGATLIRVSALEGLAHPWFKTVDDVSAYLDAIPMASMWTEDLWFAKQLTNNCWKCKKNKDEHDSQGKTADHEFEAWKMMADGGLLCDHWDWKSGRKYSLPMGSKPTLLPGVKKGHKKIVDLGCGPMADSYVTLEGEVLRVDIREEVEPDYRCDLRRLPFGNKEFDVVYSSHTLEHFARNDIQPVLKEWTRILKEEGEMRLVLPNLEWAARHVLNKEIDNDVMNVLYGAQSYDENFHKMGFTPQMLEQCLAQEGYTKFDWKFEGYHMLCRAWRKPPQDIPELASVVTLTGVKTDTAVEPRKADEEGSSSVKININETKEEKSDEEVVASSTSVGNLTLPVESIGPVSSEPASNEVVNT